MTASTTPSTKPPSHPLFSTWDHTHDPVYGTSDAAQARYAMHSSHLQPLDCCRFRYFPKYTKDLGMVRVVPTVSRVGNYTNPAKSPECVVSAGKTPTCHAGMLPAFMYLHSDHECDTARAEKRVTILFKWDLERRLDSCLSCYMGDKVCTIKGKVLKEKEKGAKGALRGLSTGRRLASLGLRGAVCQRTSWPR
ncbi:hypothetical protein IAT38_001004 [Cryptococcus sp. DSM 104549]